MRAVVGILPPSAPAWLYLANPSGMSGFATPPMRRVVNVLPPSAPAWVREAPAIGMSGLAGNAKLAAAAVGAGQGAIVGSAAGPIGTAAGAVVGGAAAYFGSSGAEGGKTQAGGRFSVSGHKAIMTQLLHEGRWDDADAETKAWFAAGMGTDDEKRRFKPKGPAVLPDGTKNVSWVARRGHQASKGGGPPPYSAGGDSSHLLLYVGAGVAAIAVVYVWNRSRKRRKSRAR